MSTHLCIKYRYQKWIRKHERGILEQTFLDIPAGTEKEEQLYAEIVDQYIKDNEWLQLIAYAHHKHTTRLMHCMHVSYLCFLQAYRHDWDYESAAIGGLLHDFVLFDKKDYDVTKFEEIWCFYHPQQALQAAEEKYELTDVSKDIIAKHMFPMAFSLPKHKETWLIAYWDKYCAIREFMHKRQGCPVVA
ncbi:MAG: hypothetical protein IJZ68_08865 [Bacteroidaceae bacterium]|nr:hypothetical protein [Bacteroidaceae bacterium]